VSRRRLASTAAVLAAAAVGGCGGSASSEQSKIQAAVSDYFSALSHHDANAICRVQTGGYWAATRAEANARLQASGRPALPADCRSGFAKLFALRGTSGPSAKVTVTAVNINSNAATAMLASGSRRQAAKFARATDGQWQISCCTGSQVTQQPHSTSTNPSGRQRS
jgi:hypothetical protein